jgi:hypothetical protein
VSAFIEQHRYEAMRRERENDFKRFLWGFVALETLTNVLYTDLYDLAVANLAMKSSDGTDAPHDIVLHSLAREKRRLSLADRFAVVASYLSPAMASEDVATFRTVKQARDAIAHGLDRLDAWSFPTSELERLLPRYLERGFEL